MLVGVAVCSTTARYFEVLVMQHILYVTMGARRPQLVLHRQTLGSTLRGLECVMGASLVFGTTRRLPLLDRRSLSKLA